VAHAIELSAPAKLNLHLRVLDRGADGYRHLETLFVRTTLADTVSIEPSSGGFALEAIGDVGDASPEENLVVRAARLFFEGTGLAGGARIRLTKRIPPGAGLGGGSSDAAATLRGLNTLHGHPLPAAELVALSASLGADVPFFASGAAAAWATGRGDRLLVVGAPEPRPLVLALPAAPLATAEVYRRLTELRGEGPERWAGAALTSLKELTDWTQLRSWAVNDFEAVAQSMLPELASLQTELEAQTGALMARMSGSGSAHFGVFDDPASAAAAVTALAPRHPDIRFVLSETAADG